MRISILVLILVFEAAQLLAQSNAHKKSSFAIIDPVYHSDKQSPESNLKVDAVWWIYGPAELESWRLQTLRERKDIAELKVGYPGDFHQVYADGSFRLKLNGQKVTNPLRFRAVGKGKVYVNDDLIFQFYGNDSVKSITFSKDKSIDELRFELTTLAEPPALLITNGLFSTANAAWEWKAETENWQPAFHFSQTFYG